MIIIPVLNDLSGTGNCGASGGCEINTMNFNVAWTIFDLSSVPFGTQVDSIRFWGYVNDNNMPHWSATPMGSINPITDDCSLINAEIQANYGQGNAYIYSDESGTLTDGWHSWPLDPASNAVSDFESSKSGMFVIGFIEHDFSSSNYINFDGYCQSNPPYLEIWVATPVELISFNASVNNNNVILNWATATETNNKGFYIEKKSGNGTYRDIAFINGHGTTTQPQ